MAKIDGQMVRKYVRPLLLALYAGVVLYLTIFSREPQDLQEQFVLIPRNKYHLVAIGWMPAVWEVVNNVLLFVPMGVLLPLCYSHIRRRSVLLVAMASSATIELTQLLLHIGLCELNDILHNTIGALLGFGGYEMMKWIWKKYTK